ncbi:MAG: DNA polymerase III subunit alpha [Pseudomonadota bacterium]
MTQFVHLSLHTQYSIVDSVVRVPALMDAIRERQMAAIAMTDRYNLFGLVKFYRKALSSGIKPLVGADLSVTSRLDDAQPARLTLLCRNLDGYRNLTRLISRAYLEGQTDGQPCLARHWLDAESMNGLVVLAGGVHGVVGQLLGKERTAAVKDEVDYWQALTSDHFFIDVQRTGRDGEAQYVSEAVPLADRHGVPLVATNDVRFIDASDFNAHEARVCIHESRLLADQSRTRRYSREQYLKSPAEMAELFADLPEAVSNTVELATMLNLDIALGKSYLPRFPLADESASEDEHLVAESQRRLADYLATRVSANAEHRVYHERMQAELDVICGMGFAGYFLIVADFIDWAKQNAIPVGPGRGSGAGSLVAWVLGITDLDPIAYDLLFERFLNPERVSMPDFDIDFCMEGRDRVIDYVAERYGRDRVSQIITYGTMAAKAVVRDAGRVLGHGYGFRDSIAKLIPFEVGMTLEKALQAEPELARLIEENNDAADIMELARALEGLVRNAGKHAGGVVIAPTQLTDFAPLYCEPGPTNVVTQFDKDDVEAAGLVKFDFLGLRTLTIIDWSVRAINARRQQAGESAIDISELPLDDKHTFGLLRRANTTAVFQLESRGMKELIKRLRPDSFDDLIALVALYRPGPLQSGMVDDFIERKHQDPSIEIDYLHPDLKPVLESTYGVILYQEQVMQIAQILAGYTLGGADMLRRAMGKKKPEEMAKQREVFTSGARDRGIDDGQATHIFDLMEKFAGYGFNKSHSAAYALLSYQTAWLKAHYPAEFMAAVMSADIDNTDKLVPLKADCRECALDVQRPNINASKHEFSATDDGRILYGLGAIKGVGRNVVEAIVAERHSGGAYQTLGEFCRRLSGEKLTQRTYEALLRAGSFDAIDDNRRALVESLPGLLKGAEQEAAARSAGQSDMFGIASSAVVDVAPATASAATVAPWTEWERLKAEKEALGLYLSGHPFATVRHDAAYLTSSSLGQIMATPEPMAGQGGERGFGRKATDVTVAGLLMDVRRRGKRVSLVLDDDTAQMEVTLFNEVAEQFQHVLTKDTILVVDGSLRYDDFANAWRVTARRLEAIDQVIEKRARQLVLSMRTNGAGPGHLHALHDLLMAHRGGRCDVLVRYTGTHAEADLKLGADWVVRPTRQLRDDLEMLLGPERTRLIYDRQH